MIYSLFFFFLALIKGRTKGIRILGHYYWESLKVSLRRGGENRERKRREKPLIEDCLLLSNDQKNKNKIRDSLSLSLFISPIMLLLEQH